MASAELVLGEMGQLPSVGFNGNFKITGTLGSSKAAVIVPKA